MLETRACCPHCQRMVLVGDLDLDLSAETFCPHCQTHFMVLSTADDAREVTADERPLTISCHRCGKPVEEKAFYLATFLFARGSCSIGPEALNTVLLTGNGGPDTRVYTKTFHDPDGYQSLLNGQYLESVARRYLTYFTQAYGRTYGTELGETRSLLIIPPELCLQCGQDDIRAALPELQTVGAPAVERPGSRMAWWAWLLALVFAGTIVAVAMHLFK